MDNTKDTQARFWVEAQVSIAKSTVFLATAEKELEAGDLMPASVSAYYSLFHLSLALMWLLPESMPPSRHRDLIEIRDTGNELPNKLTSHKQAEAFLCAGQVDLPVPKLRPLYQRALKLREFASYGPRVTYDGEQPQVGDCSFQTRDVRDVVKEIPNIFINALRAALPRTAYDADLAPVVLDGALDLLRRTEFPFKNWYSMSVIKRAEILIDELRAPASA
jgi:uncharacterized protein (UPF0332 family)